MNDQAAATSLLATSRALGGFLPLRVPANGPATLLSLWLEGTQDAWFLHNARSALRALWSDASPARIWLPAYVCPEVAEAVPEGADVHYYPLDPALRPRVDYLDGHLRAADHVLAVDYFGRPVADPFRSLVRRHPDVGWIEDRAQALNTGQPAWGDWILYSPRKLCGTPDGGILAARSRALPALSPRRLDAFGFVLPLIERHEDEDERDNERWYATFRREEAKMTVEPHAMSRLSLNLLRHCDVEADTGVRRRNFAALHERLARWAFLDSPVPGFAPLGFPIRVQSAARLVERLALQRVFAARHWPELPSDPEQFEAEHRLSRELVTLPCDYRYDEADMHRLAELVIDGIARS